MKFTRFPTMALGIKNGEVYTLIRDEKWMFIISFQNLDLGLNL